MIRAFLALFRKSEPTKHVWEPTGVRYTFTGHDQSKAEIVHQREQRQASARRAKAAKALTEQAREITIVNFEAEKAKRRNGR